MPLWRRGLRRELLRCRTRRNGRFRIPLGERGFEGDVKINFSHALLPFKLRRLLNARSVRPVAAIASLYPIKHIPSRPEAGRRNATKRRRDFALCGDASSALLPPLRQRPPMGVEQRRAKVERVARGFPNQRKRSRPARREAAGQRILLESELRAEFLRQVLHAGVVGQADDLDRLDAMVGGGAQDALEQLLADAAATMVLVD